MSVLKCLTWTTRLDKILDRVEPGDMIRFHRGLFVHHAVYVGRGRAVHHHLGSCDGEVIEATMEYLAKGDLMKVVRVTESPFPAQEIVRRARSQLGPLPYSLHGGNCEHFTTWVYYGVRESRQLSGLCRHELRLLSVVKHRGGGCEERKLDDDDVIELPSTSQVQQQQQQQQLLNNRLGTKIPTPENSRECDQDDSKNNNSTNSEELADQDQEQDSDSSFIFVPPRPPKYRHTKNPARIACNHARSCLKVLAIQSVVGLAAVPLYKCSVQAHSLQQLAGQFTRARRRRRQQRQMEQNRQDDQQQQQQPTSTSVEPAS